MTLDERILAYLDGSANPDDVADLDRVLEADAAARDRFARLCEQDAALRQILGCAPAPAIRKLRRRPAPTGPTTPWAAIAFAAAALLFVLLLAAALSPTPSAPPRPTQVALPPRPVPVAIPEPAPKPEPPPRVEPPKPPPPVPKRMETKNDFVAPPPEPRKPEPRPEPAPKVDPPPTPPAPAPKVTEAVVIVARLEQIKGQVMVITGNESVPAKDGFALAAGQGVQTMGPESSVHLRLDTTVVEVGAETRIGRITNGSGKQIALDHGSIAAQVSRQLPGQPLVFVTPQAEARVLGTKLTLVATAAETRLEVREGRVRFMRLSDKSFVEVASGQFAVASDAVKPAARKIPPPPRTLLDEKFDDLSRWTRLEGGFPTTTVKGAVEINVSKRDEPYPGTWHAAGGLRTRQSFSAPFKVSVNVGISHKSSSINTLLVLTPKAPGPRTGKNEIAVRLRDGKYSVIVETQHLEPDVDAKGDAPISERWTIEFGLKHVSLSVNGKQVLSRDHGLTIAQEYFVELQGTAKEDAPDGARVRFDDVLIEQ